VSLEQSGKSNKEDSGVPGCKVREFPGGLRSLSTLRGLRDF
jgi:hypothetical protein